MSLVVLIVIHATLLPALNPISQRNTKVVLHLPCANIRGAFFKDLSSDGCDKVMVIELIEQPKRVPFKGATWVRRRERYSQLGNVPPPMKIASAFSTAALGFC